jgi:hypothetical protein
LSFHSFSPLPQEFSQATCHETKIVFSPLATVNPLLFGPCLELARQAKFHSANILDASRRKFEIKDRPHLNQLSKKATRSGSLPERGKGGGNNRRENLGAAPVCRNSHEKTVLLERDFHFEGTASLLLSLMHV